MFEGVFTALVTPFRDGEIHAPALRALVDHQVDAGVETPSADGMTPRQQLAAIRERATDLIAAHPDR